MALHDPFGVDVPLNFNITHSLFIIGEIQCIPENVRANHAKLKIARPIELPPQSSVLVSCKATKSAKHFGMPHVVSQPVDNS